EFLVGGEGAFGLGQALDGEGGRALSSTHEHRRDLVHVQALEEADGLALELALLLVLDVEAVAPLLKLASGLDGLEGLATGLSVHEELKFGDSRLAVRRVADDALPDRERATPARVVVTGDQNGLAVPERALQGHVSVVVDLVVGRELDERLSFIGALDLDAQERLSLRHGLPPRGTSVVRASGRPALASQRLASASSGRWPNYLACSGFPEFRGLPARHPWQWGAESQGVAIAPTRGRCAPDQPGLG